MTDDEILKETLSIMGAVSLEGKLRSIPRRNEKMSNWRKLEKLSSFFHPTIQKMLDTLEELFPAPTKGNYETFLSWLSRAVAIGLITDNERSDVVSEIGLISTSR